MCTSDKLRQGNTEKNEELAVAPGYRQLCLVKYVYIFLWNIYFIVNKVRYGMFCAYEKCPSLPPPFNLSLTISSEKYREDRKLAV